MRRTIALLLVVATVFLLCACGRVREETTTPATPATAAPADSTASPVQETPAASAAAEAVLEPIVMQENSTNAQAVAPKEKSSLTINELYQDEIDYIIQEMKENITDNAQYNTWSSYCHGGSAKCDDSGKEQCVALFTPDGINLSVEIMRADEDGYLLTVRDDLGLLAGSLTATVRAGEYNGVPALFVVTTNYDYKSRFGSISVYSLENNDINFILEKQYTGEDEYKAIEQEFLSSAGEDICSFKEEGAGTQLDKINLK